MDPALAYHQRSKHHPQRYAPGPGGLDWASQPDPFRRFAGAPRVELTLLAGETAARWDDLFRPGGLPARRFALETLGPLLQLSLGLAAWKSQGGSRWALRCNPSSGNLHPTEAYLICPDLPGLAAGVYHYRPEDHSLERRAAAPLAWSGGVLLALTGIHWREAWKYGMRAFRYCQHDCGHALAAIAYAAAALGWPVRLLDDWGDDQVAALVGVDRDADFPGAEAEAVEALVWVGPGHPPAAGAVLAMMRGVEWRGQANSLSRDHRDWPDIPEVAAATRRPAGVESLLEASADARAKLPPLAPVCQEPASVLIRRRRSAQAFDGVTGLDAAAFYRLLDALLPRPGQPPWSLLATPPRVHPVLFAHRVTGLEAGVYCLVRDPEQRPALAAAMRPDWLWVRPPGCPEHLPLYLLAPWTRASSPPSSPAARTSPAIPPFPWPCWPTSTTSRRGGPGCIASASGKRACWATRFTWRPRPPGSRVPASAAISTTWPMTPSASPRGRRTCPASRTSTTSPWAAPWWTGAWRASPPTPICRVGPRPLFDGEAQGGGRLAGELDHRHRLGALARREGGFRAQGAVGDRLQDQFLLLAAGQQGEFAAGALAGQHVGVQAQVDLGLAALDHQFGLEIAGVGHHAAPLGFAVVVVGKHRLGQQGGEEEREKAGGRKARVS
jgi:SagB-type dehydrogenase family enzyme